MNIKREGIPVEPAQVHKQSQLVDYKLDVEENVEDALEDVKR